MKPKVFITQADALTEEFKGRTNYWVCRPEIVAAKGLQICRAVLPPGEGHNFHRHPELEEVIYVLEGEVAHIPADVVHATFNTSARDALILAVLSPASQKGPFAVDMSGEEPWKSLRTAR